MQKFLTHLQLSWFARKDISLLNIISWVSSMKTAESGFSCRLCICESTRPKKVQDIIGNYFFFWLPFSIIGKKKGIGDWIDGCHGYQTTAVLSIPTFWRNWGTAITIQFEVLLEKGSAPPPPPPDMLWRAKSLDQEALKRRTYRYITYIKHKNSSQCLHNIYTVEKVQRLNTGNDFKITIK